MNTQIDLHALVDAIGDAVIVCDAQGRHHRLEPGGRAPVRLDRGRGDGPAHGHDHPERLRKRHWDGYDKSMQTGHTRYAHDVLRVPAVDKAGRAMSIAFTVAMLFGPDGKVSACGSVIRDETSRFAEDRALRKRLAELEAQLGRRQAPEAILRGQQHLQHFRHSHEQGTRRRSHPRLHPRAIRARPARSCWPGWAPT